MNGSTLAYVVDLTEDPVVVGCVAAGEARVCTEVAGLFPLRVVVRSVAGAVTIDVGPLDETLHAEVRRGTTLVFDHLGHRLPRLADAEVQQGIMAGFWQALRRRLAAASGEPGPAEGSVPADCAGSVLPACDLYLVVPSTYPVELLDTLRLALSSSSDGCQLRHSFNEWLSVIVYHVDGPLLSRYVASTPTLVTVIEARSDQDIRLLQMQCAQRPAAWDVRLLYQARVRLDSADLHHLLEVARRPQASKPVCLVQVADSGLRQCLQGALSAAGAEQSVVFYPVDETVCEVKVRGAMRLVQRSRGEADPAPEIIVEQSHNLGVDIGAEHFSVVLPAEAVAAATCFPLQRSCPFAVRGPLSHSLRFNLCGGYADRVAEALQLGHLLLPRERCQGLERFEVVVSLTLESHASGTASLALISPREGTPVLVDRTAFRLPSLVA